MLSRVKCQVFFPLPLVICVFPVIPLSRPSPGEATSTRLQLGTLTQGSSLTFATNRLDDYANYLQVFPFCLPLFPQTDLLMHFFLHNCSVINSSEHSPFCCTRAKRPPCCLCSGRDRRRAMQST